MEVTRRYWTAVGLGAVLLIGTVLFERPILLGGAMAIGAWLIARQYMFVQTLVQVNERLTVDHSFTPERVATDEDTHVTFSVALHSASPLPLSVESNPPIAAAGSTHSERTVDITPGEQRATTTYTIHVPTAGAFTFDDPTVTVGDRAGLFREILDVESSSTLQVQPRGPRNVHIGEGGNKIATALGDHQADRLGSGLEPAELREYTTGDAANRIDWKATARLGEPFVREFEPESDQTTVLVVDHRATMDQGHDGETKLDYAREVGLVFLDRAWNLDDPLGLYTVGDEGLTGHNTPTAGRQQYASVRTRLQELRPTSPTGLDRDGDETQWAADTTTGNGDRPRMRTPADARRAAKRLRSQDDTYATTLLPYYEDIVPYVERIQDNPLFESARNIVTRLQGTLWTVILTDDTNPAELRQAVKLLRRGDNYVLVFVTPSVLFEPGGLGDLERAYDRYLEFEKFRRTLSRMDRVTAFEVGPGDRLSAILTSQQQRMEDRGVNTQ